MSTPPDGAGPERVRGLRANSFAAVVILLLEYGLGIWVNLFAGLPVSDRGASMPTGFARAVADGPVGLSVHALVGVALVASATTALVRALRVGRAALVGATGIGLVAILVAAWTGARFIGDPGTGLSMVMAVGAGVAIGAYALVLFVTGPGWRQRPGD